MWIISQTGFVSLVQDNKDASKVWIRARVKEDIAMMFPAYADQIITKIGADYIFRLIVPKDVAALAMWNAVQDVDYDSHAKEVMNRRSAPSPKRMSAYYKIWSALAELQPFAPYAHHPRSVPGMAVHQAPLPAATGKGYPWARNKNYQSTMPAFSGPTGFRNGKALTAEDYNGKADADWPASEAVDLISGADDELPLSPVTQAALDRLDPGWDEDDTDEDDADWQSLLRRENEHSGPIGKRARRARRRQHSKNKVAGN